MKTMLLIIIPIIVGVAISIQPIIDYFSEDTSYSHDVDRRIGMAANGFAIASNIDVYSVTVEDEIQGLSITTKSNARGFIHMDDPLPILQKLFPNKNISSFSVMSEGEEVQYTLENGKLGITVNQSPLILIIGNT